MPTIEDVVYSDAAAAVGGLKIAVHDCKIRIFAARYCR